MTDRNISVDALTTTPVSEQAVELVERKGLGHPDSICDGLAEHVSRALSTAYRDRFDAVLHHNTDEAQLIAGKSSPEWGGGTIVEPIRVVLAGRATQSYNGETIPTERIALDAARDYLSETVPELEFGRDIVVDVEFGEGSGDLQHVVNGDAQIPAANDTSFGVGYAPLSDTEQVVSEVEHRLNTAYAADHPEVGSDIKVMGKRVDDTIDLTVAAAMVDQYLSGLDEYREAVDQLADHVRDIAADHTDYEVTVSVNTADDYDAESVYLTVTGTSAEHGDDGSVGRGNRVNGLITPNRPMSLEAASGKNPVSHVGKLYNILAHDMASRITTDIPAVTDSHVRVLSQIDSPLDQPQIADIRVATTDDTAPEDVRDDVETIADEMLENVDLLTDHLIDGNQSTF